MLLTGILLLVYSLRLHSSNPLPFEKGGCTFGVSIVEGGFENFEIKGAPFQVRRPNFLRGVGFSSSHKGNALSWILL